MCARVCVCARTSVGGVCIGMLMWAMIILHRWHPSFDRLYYYYIILCRVFATAQAKWENLRIQFSLRRTSRTTWTADIPNRSVATQVLWYNSKWPTKKMSNHKRRIWSVSCLLCTIFLFHHVRSSSSCFSIGVDSESRKEEKEKAIAECVSVGGKKRRFSTNCANGIRWDGRLRGANDEKGKRINVSYRLAAVVCVLLFVDSCTVLLP